MLKNLKYMLKSMKITFDDSPTRYVIIILLLLLNAIIPIVVLHTTKSIIGELMNTEIDGTNILLLLCFYLVFQYLGTLKTIINAIGSYIWISTEIVLQKKLLGKIQEIPLISYDSEFLYNRVVLAEKSYENALQSSLLALVAFFLTTSTFIGILGYLITIDLELIVVVIILTIPQLVSKAIEVKYNVEERNATVSSKVKREKYKNCIIDRNYNRDSRVNMYLDKFFKLWRNENKYISKIEKRTENRTQIKNMIVNTISFLGYSFPVLVVISKLINGTIGADDAIVVLMALEYLMLFFNVAFRQIGNVLKQASLSEELFSFLESNESINNELLKVDSSGCISGKDISFKYPNTEDYALKNINFNINDGEKIAIVGNNGSGKTTLVKVIADLYKPSKGKMTYSDKYVEEQRVKASVVFQDYNKYSLSVLDNISFGVDNDLSKVNQSLEKSGFYQSTSNEELPLTQKLGKEFNGKDISGGQWQLLAIARGLFHLDNLFILDEPTSAIDPIAEVELFERIMKISEGVTSIFITHRLSSTKHADQVWYMEEGEIVEKGTHKELMELNQGYARLFNEQAQWYERS